MKYDTVFFDFDGTLNESGPGIFAATRAMMAELGIPDIPDERMRYMVGPPLKVGFTTILNIGEDILPKAVEVYRLKAKTCGIKDMKPYDGVISLLDDLRKAGCTVGVVTAKVRSTALEHIEMYGYKPYVDYVMGARADGSGEKPELLALACEELHVDKARTVMVGDRHYDIEAAKHAGLHSIGVLYGYGDEAELTACKADDIVATVEELRTLLFS